MDSAARPTRRCRHQAKETGDQGEDREDDGVEEHRAASFLDRSESRRGPGHSPRLATRTLWIRETGALVPLPPRDRGEASVGPHRIDRQYPACMAGILPQVLPLVRFIQPAGSGLVWLPRPDRSNSLKPPQKHEDQDDHQNQPQAAARAVAPIPAITPSWKGSQEEQDQDNQQDRTETHGLPFRWFETSWRPRPWNVRPLADHFRTEVARDYRLAKWPLGASLVTTALRPPQAK